MGVPKGARLLAALAIIVTVTNPDLEKASSIGRRPDRERARYHAAYLFDVNSGDQLATVEQVEVLTEFRRAVMIVEDRAKFGDYMFGLRQLEAALRPFHNQVTIRARLRFNPMNALPDVPAYELRVGAPDDRLLALGPTTRSPILVAGAPDQPQSLMGATLEIGFDAGIVGQRTYPVSVVLDRKPLATTPIDFARLD